MATNKSLRKILIVTDGFSGLPSFNVRAFQFKKFFEGSGKFEYTFFNRQLRVLELLNIAVRKRKILLPLSKIIFYILRAIRFFKTKYLIQTAGKYDLVYLIKHADFEMQKALFEKGPRIVYDVNDGLWLPSNGIKDFYRFLTHSHAVVCENTYLEEYVKQFNPNTFLVPDAPQIEFFDLFEQQHHTQKDENKIRIGWVGTQRSVDVIYYLLNELEELAYQYPSLELRYVGAAEMLPRFEKLKFSSLPVYDQADMIRELLTFDISIFPQFNLSDAALRGTLKAKLYMSAGSAVVCQDVGGMNELIEDGHSGFLATTREEWKAKLITLIEDKSLRKTMGENARKRIRAEYTQQQVFDLLEDVFETVARS